MFAVLFFGVSRNQPLDLAVFQRGQLVVELHGVSAIKKITSIALRRTV